MAHAIKRPFSGGTKVMLVESVTLLVTIGTYPQQITEDVTFLVVDCSSAYNVIALFHKNLSIYEVD